MVNLAMNTRATDAPCQSICKNPVDLLFSFMIDDVAFHTDAIFFDYYAILCSNDLADTLHVSTPNSVITEAPSEK